MPRNKTIQRDTIYHQDKNYRWIMESLESIYLKYDFKLSTIYPILVNESVLESLNIPHDGYLDTAMLNNILNEMDEVWDGKLFNATDTYNKYRKDRHSSEIIGRSQIVYARVTMLPWEAYFIRKIQQIKDEKMNGVFGLICLDLMGVANDLLVSITLQGAETMTDVGMNQLREHLQKINTRIQSICFSHSISPEEYLRLLRSKIDTDTNLARQGWYQTILALPWDIKQETE